tara:strand:+ start:283 stop:771 length:489 start_codon:yes stop_codon:yes gene_type:complete
MYKKNFKTIFFYFFLVLTIFLLDRISKLYILNLAEIEPQVDIYINSVLNLYLIWNTGIGFGFLSSDQTLFYSLITFIIFLINILILVIILKSDDFKVFFFIMILGGSTGNLFDRIYYSAVPDFLDLHYNDFHWFTFNVADIFISLGVLCLIFVEVFSNNYKK